MAAFVETSSINATTVSTIDLLESRLLRIEHLLCGQTSSPSLSLGLSPADAAVQRMRDLERRFRTLLSNFRVYGELLKIYNSNPDLFHSPDPTQPPTQLSADGVQAVVLASASSYPAIQSSLIAIKDTPIPDLKESTNLINLSERTKGIRATQMAQAAEIVDLRRRSEKVVRAWYERGILENSKALADMEGRIEAVERNIRRRQKALELDDKP